MGVWPLRIILLVVAAGITDAILLLFAGFLVWHWGSVLTAGYGLLIALFALVNLRVLHRALDNQNMASGLASRVRAHGLSIALPVAYLLGSLDSGVFLQQSWLQWLVMTVPSLVNWQAIEQTLQFHRRRSFT